MTYLKTLSTLVTILALAAILAPSIGFSQSGDPVKPKPLKDETLYKGSLAAASVIYTATHVRSAARSGLIRHNIRTELKTLKASGERLLQAKKDARELEKSVYTRGFTEAQNQAVIREVRAANYAGVLGDRSAVVSHDILRLLEAAHPTNPTFYESRIFHHNLVHKDLRVPISREVVEFTSVLGEWAQRDAGKEMYRSVRLSAANALISTALGIWSYRSLDHNTADIEPKNITPTRAGE